MRKRYIVLGSLTYFVSFMAFHSALLAQESTSFAVLDLEARGVSQVEAASLSDRLRAALVRTKKATIIERGKMVQILSEQDFNLSGCTSDECAVEVGQLLGVTDMVAGSVGKVGATFSVDIRVISVKSGEIVHSLSKDHRGQIDGLLGLMTTIANELVSDMSTGDVVTDPEPPPIVTAPIPIPVPIPAAIPADIVKPAESSAGGILSARNIYDSISLKDLQTIAVGDSVYMVTFRNGRCTWELANVLNIKDDGKRVQVEIDGRIKTITTTLSQLIKKTPWLIPYIDGFSGRALSTGDHVIGYSFKNNSLSKATVRGISQGGYVALEGSNVVRGIRKIERTKAHISSIGLITGGFAVNELTEDLSAAVEPSRMGVTTDTGVEFAERSTGRPISASNIYDSISLKDLQTIAVGDSVYMVTFRNGRCTWELANVLNIKDDGKRVQVEIDGRIKTITTTLSQLIKKTPWLIPYIDGFSGRALSTGDHVIGYSFKNNSLSKATVRGISQGGYVALEGSNVVRGIRKIERTKAHISSIGLIIGLN